MKIANLFKFQLILFLKNNNFSLLIVLMSVATVREIKTITEEISHNYFTDLFVKFRFDIFPIT